MPEADLYGENHFQQDKSDDYSFQAERTFSVNDVCQCLPRVRDHGQLSGQKIGTLFQLIFILEPGIKAFQVRSLPKYVRLFRGSNEADMRC